MKINLNIEENPSLSMYTRVKSIAQIIQHQSEIGLRWSWSCYTFQHRAWLRHALLCAAEKCIYGSCIDFSASLFRKTLHLSRLHVNRWSTQEHLQTLSCYWAEEPFVKHLLTGTSKTIKTTLKLHWLISHAEYPASGLKLHPCWAASFPLQILEKCL